MSSRSKSRILIFIIAVLLISNIAMLIFFLSGKPEMPKPDNERKPGYGISETLKKDAAFDDQQVKQYEELREKHWQKMKPMFHDMQATKNSFYSLVKDASVSDSTISTLASQIGEKQKAIDYQIFHHFRQIRNLCRPDQQSKFDTIYSGIVKRMSGGGRGPGNGPKRGGDSTKPDQR